MLAGYASRISSGRVSVSGATMHHCMLSGEKYALGWGSAARISSASDGAAGGVAGGGASAGVPPARTSLGGSPAPPAVLAGGSERRSDTRYKRSRSGHASPASTSASGVRKHSLASARLAMAAGSAADGVAISLRRVRAP